MESLVGRTLGKYALTAMIGGGGMATVYEGRHPGLDQKVAVKVLHPFLATDSSFVDRFRREAHAVAALRHPNIVRVLDSDHDEHLYYMVMEYIGGPTLSSVLTGRAGGGGLSLPEIRRIFPPLCAAIDYAAGRGMVHRDIKPANIILTEDGEPILTDYGIAKMIGSTSLTSPGTVVGSAHYMSPEQAQGQECDVRSDLYSLGVVLFECLAGTVPFDGDTTATVLVKHITAPVPSVRALRPNLPPALEPMLARALAKAPRDRYELGSDFADELMVALAPSKTTAVVTEFTTPATAGAGAPPPPPPPFTPQAPTAVPTTTPTAAPIPFAAPPAQTPPAAGSEPSPTTPPRDTPPPPTPPRPPDGTPPPSPATTQSPSPAATPPPEAAAPPAWPPAAPANSTSVEHPLLGATGVEAPPAVEASWTIAPTPPAAEPAPAPPAAERPPTPPSPTRTEPTTPPHGTPPISPPHGTPPATPPHGTPSIPPPGLYATPAQAPPPFDTAAPSGMQGGPPRQGGRKRMIVAAAVVVALLMAGGAAAAGLALRDDSADDTTTTLEVTTTATTVSTTTSRSTSTTSTTRRTTTTTKATTTTVKPTTTTVKPTTTTKRVTTTTKRVTTTTKKQTTTTKKPTTTQPTSPPGTIGPGTTTGPPPTIGPG